MRVFNQNILFLSILATLFFVFSSCKKEYREEQVYDNIIYEVDTVRLYSTSAEKTKQKTPTQYISILYSDLFNKTIPTNELSELNELSLATGDKTMVNELTLSHYLKASFVDQPTDAEMRADIQSFVSYVYRKFYQRYPTEYEKIYLADIIIKDSKITVDDIYTSFVLSNEYYYY
ncbi:MAG: hypothetical protein RIC15_04395 [Vicingaceae bacterium]